jgi:electron transport complex protein RnfC
MGGACFPTFIKLCPPPTAKAECVIINAVECEPYITADFRLMMEHADEILVGLELLMKGAKVTEDQVIVTFHEKGKFPDIMTIHEINDWEFIERSVVNNWDKFLGAVNKYGKANPFTK